MARGSWLLDTGIARRWDDDSLDDAILPLWDEASRGRFQPLNDGEARADTPHPYVCYEMFERPSGVSHSGGVDPGEHKRYEDRVIQFAVHAKSTADKLGKTIAAEIASKVLDAYGPSAATLDVAPDCHLLTIGDGDWSRREGDDEWVHYVQLILRIEGTYKHAPRDEPSSGD